LTQRTTWCAASTHDGEENICIDAHKKIQKIHQNILTIIIPRHIDRVKKIFDECSRNNLKAQILNDEEKIHDAVEILIINSFGKIPKFFDCCKTVFIGISLVKKLKLVGGQNPIEAAKNGCKIYHGPYVYNFSEVYESI
jgi:3-deoxy-D-manno-octulosonic-acid transferase